jgi:UDP-glucuronate 4-epimerase
MITGGAGFIGSALALRLLQRGDEIISIDCLNDYYDVTLKQARLARTQDHPNFTDLRLALEDRAGIARVFAEYRPQRVVNLAAQVGVRYSIQNPLAYVDANLLGFGHILEGCRKNDVEHLVYASSSSVYGANTSMPFSVHDNVDHPLSLYAATKKANELMAHTYSHLYRLPTTGLRFFTVYGPWSRPDMAMLSFSHKIMRGEPIDVFNYGKHRRDFTYIDDIVEGIVRVLDRIPQPDPQWRGERPDSASSSAPYRIYNIGSNCSIELMRYIEALEENLGKKAILNMLPLQDGDMIATYADVDALVKDTGYKPDTPLEVGVKRFAEWFLDYYNYA